MRSIGLDVGEYSVKIVELNLNKKNIFIHQLQEKILNPNLVGHDKELEVIEFVRAFMATGDYSQSRWVIAVPQDQVTTRFKTFPFSDRLKIQKSLSFEMEEDIPFDTDLCVFDAKMIQTQGLMADVLASAIPKTHVEKILDLAASCGIQPHLVTIEGIAFANLIEQWDSAVPAINESLQLTEEKLSKKNLQVILNIGHKKTLFNAYENGRLIFVRSLYWGSSQLLEEIVKKNQCTLIEAMHVLQTQGMILLTKQGATFDQTQVSNTLSKSLRELVRDLQMTVLELQSEFNAEITQLNFTGGGCLLPNLGGFLTQHLEIVCNPISLLQSYSSSILSFVPAEHAFAVESRFSTAFGLAIEGFKKPRNPPINLLKGEFAKQNDQFKVFWQVWGSSIQVATAALVVLFVWSFFRESFSFDLMTKGEEAVVSQAKTLARLPKKQANENGIKKYIRDNKKKAADLKMVAQVAQMNSALELLKKVSESAPSKEQVKIDLVSFIVKDDQVQMTGYVGSPRELTSLSKNLESIAMGAITSQPATLPTQANKVTFNLSFKTDRGLVK